MILLTFSIYDEKAKAFMAPFFMNHIAQASRIFKDCLNDPKVEHAFARNPGDYTLWQVGQFNDDTGVIISDPRELLGNGLAYKSLSDDHETQHVQISDDPPIQPSTQG